MTAIESVCNSVPMFTVATAKNWLILHRSLAAVINRRIDMQEVAGFLDFFPSM